VVPWLALERHVALGILHTLSARLEDKTHHLRIRSFQPERPKRGWEEWEQNDTNPAGSQAALSFIDRCRLHEIVQPVFGVTGASCFHQGMKIGLFFGIARAVDEANHIVIDRLGQFTQNCPDSVAGQA